MSKQRVHFGGMPQDDAIDAVEKHFLVEHNKLIGYFMSLTIEDISFYCSQKDLPYRETLDKVNRKGWPYHQDEIRLEEVLVKIEELGYHILRADTFGIVSCDCWINILNKEQDPIVSGHGPGSTIANYLAICSFLNRYYELEHHPLTILKST